VVAKQRVCQAVDIRIRSVFLRQLPPSDVHLAVAHDSRRQCIMSYDKGVPRIFIGPRSKGRRPRAGVGSLGRGQQPPFSPARGSGSAVSFPAGFRAQTRLPKGFPIFSAHRTTSPDTIVNCGLSCSHWGQDTPALRTPLLYEVFDDACAGRFGSIACARGG